MNMKLPRLTTVSASLSVILFCAAASAQPADSPGLDQQLTADSTVSALKLSDEQKAAIATVISERDAAIAAAENDEAKAALHTEAEAKLLAVLSEEQRTQFQALFDNPQIKFNFRFQKWADVLPWLANQADLSLVMEEVPQGTFNYSDKRAYEPDEAIDLVNGWLMIKGFTLIRRDQLLLCVSLKDGIPDGSVPRIALEDLANRGRFEFVTVLIPLEARVPDTVMAEIQPLSSAYGVAKALPATKQLLVTDAADIVRNIQQVVKLVPPPAAAPPKKVVPPAPKPELKVYALEHANPKKAGEVLKPLISGTLVVDEDASQISINAIPAEQAKAQTIIDQLEANQGKDHKGQLKSYPVRTDNSSELVASMTLAVPDATLRYDAAARRLVVFGTEADHKVVTDGLLELETQAAIHEDQLSVHPLQNIDPATAQQLIASVLPDVRVTIDARTKTLIAVGRVSDLRAVKTLIDQLEPQTANIQEAVLQPYAVRDEYSSMASTVITSVVPTARVTADARNKRLLVVAKPEDHETIAATLQKLMENTGEGVVPKFHNAEGINFGSVAPLLRALAPNAQLTDLSFKRKLLAIASPADQATIENVLNQVRDDLHAGKRLLKFYPLSSDFDMTQFSALMRSLDVKASVSVDEKNNRLTVTGNGKDHEKVAQLLSQLQPEVPAEEPQLKVYPLPKQIDTATFTSMLTERHKRAQVRVDAANKRLLITATEAGHEIVAQLMEQLTTDLPDHDRGLKAYPLPKDVSTTTVTSLLSTLAPEASVTLDTENERILVTANAEMHGKVSAALEQLAAGLMSRDTSVKAYPLPKQVAAATVTSTLATVAPAATVTVDAENERVLVTTTDKLHAQVAVALEQLTAGVMSRETSVKAYPLPKQVASTTVTSTLATVAPAATVTIDTENERVLVTTTDKLHAQVAAALEQLTAGVMNRDAVVKTYPLPKQVTSATVSSTLAGVAPTATVTVDAENERILVTTTEKVHADVAAALEQLTAGLTPKKPQLKAFPLPENVATTTITSLLMPIAPKAVVNIDTVGKRVLITATEQDLAVIAPVLEQLAEGEGSTKRSLKSYPLKANVAPATVYTLLSNLTPTASVTTDTAAHRLLITATAKDHATIEEAIAQITRDARGETPDLQYYPLERADGTNAVTVLKAIVPTATVTYERENNRLSVIASPSDHELLQKTLTKLETAAPEKERRELKVYNVTKSQKARFSSIQSSLAQELPGLQVLTGGEPDEMIVWAKPSQHEVVATVMGQLTQDVPADQKPSLVVYPIHKVEAESVAEVLQEIFPDATIKVDERASRLLIRARPAMQATIKSAIEQLDADIPEGREIKLMVYPVKGLNASTALSLITQEVPRVTVIQDTVAQTFIVRGRLEEHQEVAALLETLKASAMESQVPAVYPSYNSNPERERDFLQRAFPTATVVADRENRTLTVVASAEEQAKIKKTMEELKQANFSGARASDLQVYEVRNVNTSELSRMLSTAVPRAKVVFANNQVLTWAQGDDQAVIKQIVEGIKGNSGDVTVAAFDVDKLNLTVARNILSSVAPGITFYSGQDGKSLIASVNAEQKTKIEAALVQLKGSPAMAQETSLKFYQVDRTQAASIRSVLVTAVPGISLLTSTDGTQLFGRVTEEQHQKIEEALAQLDSEKPFDNKRTLQVYSLAKGGTYAATVLQRMVPTAVYTSGPETDQYTIEATAADHEKIAAVLQQLEAAKTDKGKTLKFYSVNPQSISSVRTTLAQVAPRVSLTASSDSTRLIGLVTPDQHEQISGALEQLAAEKPFETKRTLQVYSLAKGGTYAATILQRMVPTAVYTSGPETDQYTVEATAADHEKIAAVLQQLEAAKTDKGKTLKFYSVDPQSISSVRTTLAQVAPRVSLTASTDSTRLIGLVTPDQHEKIAAALEQLAAEQPFKSNRELKIYSITKSGSRTSTVLARMVPSAVISTGSEADQLMIEATEADHARIAELMTQLEAAGTDNRRELKFYSVEPDTLASVRSTLASVVPRVSLTASTDNTRLIAHVTAEEDQKITAALEKLAAEQPFKTNRILKFYMVTNAGPSATTVLTRQVPSAVISTGAQPGQVMIEATPEQHDEIAELLTQLETAAKDDTLKLRFYEVDPQHLASTRSVIARVAPQVSLTASADSTRLIATVTEVQHQKIVEALETLAKENPFDSKRKLQFYSIAGLGSSSLSVLRRMVPQALINRGSQGDQAMVEATEAEHAKVKEVLESLKLAAQDDERSLQHYSVPRDLLQNAQTVLASAVPGITVTTSPDGTRLIALVTAEQHTKIAETLKQLAKSAEGAPKRSTVVYDIAGADPIAIQSALTPFSSADPTVQITVDSISRRVYVHAFEDRHADIREAMTQILSGLENGAGTKVAAYYVGERNGREAADALTALYPDATIVTDRNRRLIIATATPEQHEHIKALAEQMAGTVTMGDDATPVTYETKHVDATHLRTVLRNLFRQDTDFRVSVDTLTGQVVAVARAKQHDVIRELLKQIDQPTEASQSTLQVYKVAPLSARTVINTLQPLVSRHVAITSESSGREILVSAPADEHARIAELLQQIGVGSEEMEKKLAVYRISPLDATSVIRALTPLVSKHASVSAERSGQGLIVSAPPEEQKKIKQLIQQMRDEHNSTDGMVIRSYQMARGEVASAISVLRPMFPDATLVSDARREVLVATATPEDHKTIDEVVKQLSGQDRTLRPVARIYPMNQADGRRIIAVLQDTFSAADKVQLTYDRSNQTIVGVARPDQHEVITSILKELDPKDGPGVRMLKSYSVEDRDGAMINRALSGVLQQKDPGATVVYDYNTEMILATTHERGHKAVQETIDRFLPEKEKQVEVYQLSFLDPESARAGIDRMISSEITHWELKPDIHADDNLQQLWIRATPENHTEIRDLLVKMGEVSLARRSEGTSGGNLRSIPVGRDMEDALRRIQELWPRLRNNPLKIMTPEDARSLPAQFSVPAEDLKDLPAAEEPSAEGEEAPAKEAAEDVSLPAEPVGPSPVVIIPGDGRITIASDDTEALDQLESILRTISVQTSGGTRNRDFNIRQLRNTSASDVAVTLRQIFANTADLTSFGNVALVPEERLNALIIYGSRRDRQRVDQLLEVLDSENLDSTRAYHTELVPMKYASASRVEDILEGVFRVQLSSGGRRRSIQIPSGVPAEVATVLRQINAAAAAPLLTIEIQRETNSLVLKAPRDLLDEVKALAIQLDESSQKNRSTGVTLLPLKKTSSRRVMELLGRVLD